MTHHIRGEARPGGPPRRGGGGVRRACRCGRGGTSLADDEAVRPSSVRPRAV